MKDTTCCLCGSEDTHPCGDDHLCDRCCVNHMECPEFEYKWIQKIIDRIHQLKLKIETYEG